MDGSILGVDSVAMLDVGGSGRRALSTARQTPKVVEGEPAQKLREARLAPLDPGGRLSRREFAAFVASGCATVLEDQQVAGNDGDARLDDIIRETNPRLFWD